MQENKLFDTLEAKIEKLIHYVEVLQEDNRQLQAAYLQCKKEKAELAAKHGRIKLKVEQVLDRINLMEQDA